MTTKNREQFYTQDHELLELLQLSETVAKSKASVLIQGATGSGKRSLAAYIQQNSSRANQVFSSFDVTQVALGDQEAELQRLMSQSKTGTLLLIEVAQLSQAVQGKLYQFINEGADVRMIATSSQNVAEAVKRGEFREDLFYRLNVVNLKIPALSQRLGDIEFLAKKFVQKWAEIHGKPGLSLSGEAIQMLNAHAWPGNVRELDNAMERAVLLSNQAEIRARDIQLVSKPISGPHADAGATAGVPLSWKPGRTLDEIERNVILEALKHHDGNRTHTAKALGISIRTLRNKLAEYRVMGIHA